MAQFATLPRDKASVREWVKSLPNILAGQSFRGIIASLERARARHKPIIWGLGGHVVKCGLSPTIIHLMDRGYVSAVAMNGSTLIHDFEIAIVGFTSEDVLETLTSGHFGMAEETGAFIHQAISQGEKDGLGIGESVGRFLVNSRRAGRARFQRYSLTAAAYRRSVPVTVHEAIGTDTIHNHPAMDARVLGAASHRDFLLLAALVKEMDGGGVYLNVGSAVILPEVFLKCVSLAANIDRMPRAITTVNLDFIQHYRPMQNVVLRPTQLVGSATPGGKEVGRGYALTGHHEIMIPLLAAALRK